MTPELLAHLAAGLLWVCLLAYTVTGLADYGGGVWDLLALGPAGKDQRRLIARVLAPIWEVNHIWLIAIVVLAFSCFPAWFAWYSRHLHMPLAAMLLGLVFRGSAFTFRSYHPEQGGGAWGRVFGIASLLTPIALGLCLGAVVSEAGDWRGAFQMAIATTVVLHGSLLAAVYLVGESDRESLRIAFRFRARIAVVMTALSALATLSLAGSAAPRFFARMTSGLPALVLHLTTSLTGLGLLAALGAGRDSRLRPLVLIQSGALVGGLALAQYPYLRHPDFPIVAAAAHPTTLTWVLAIFAIGSSLLVPALIWLFRIFRQPVPGTDSDR